MKNVDAENLVEEKADEEIEEEEAVEILNKDFMNMGLGI